MDRLIHTSLSGLRGAMARQATTANNLANANTVGFRAELSTARALWVQGGGFGARAPSSQEVTAANMHGGTVTETGRDLDIALRGEALLAVQAADGSEAYTRRGDLQVSPSGLLTTGDGRPVLGDGGPITLPPADSVRIADDGAVWIVPSGGDPNVPQQVDRLKLANPTGSRVLKAVDGLFRVENGGILPSDPDGRLTPRSLEGSNVEVSQALIDMIDASRAWDTQLNLITTARDLDTSAADLMRLPS
ncbi:flagellar basal body rod protein FlgF [Sphingosinicella sp. LHD-64]|uniref:flagellar basal body rod protein FlgF n=1 Tax=Sphingosinicella sp. LHD-64 TaxID=3072139 RepID=UPI00280CF34B|nr:flagellar basal body rod protein FlgF [Sphingosinicella sp. LHD-64]MDQ8757187.1 flagellar basal body rod protein FlgF [Sphingosinicella sp. LHD-64]